MARATEIKTASFGPETSEPHKPEHEDTRLSPKYRARALFRAQFAPTRFRSLLAMIGEELPKDAAILDFGCGGGRNTYALLDLGFTNVTGYDIVDYLQLRHPEDRERFRIGARMNGQVPFDDDTFDLIISDQVFEHCMDQVAIFRELHRITRPGGRQLHVIPAPYNPIEPHVRVPLGNFIVRPLWYRFWAYLGFRSKYTHGLSAAEAAERGLFTYHKGLNYVSCAGYKIIWRRLGYDWRFVDQEFFDTHWRSSTRMLGKVNRILPVFGWLKRVFKVRHVLLTKLA